MLNIPTERRGSFPITRMSYLKSRTSDWTAQQPAAPFTLDFNIANIISRLECYHAANLLESVNYYGLLGNL
jgi:hypothetical protein